MQHQTPCNIILLAGNEGCRVTYCETHQTTELEIGAFSLRLDIEAFSTLNALTNEAMAKINTLHASKQSYQTLMQTLMNKH
ncbi:MAG: hypothetical protein Q7V02_00115 [Methylophilus sp.]|nr:hypothetical protein [Methylophilus sp.]